MADRSLRGMRLGYQSMQSEEGVEFASRTVRVYQDADGGTFEVTFSAEAEVPEFWSNPRTGQEGVLLDAKGKPVVIEETEQKAARTHWDMLLERRTREELEELLAERLEFLRARRGQQKVGV